MSERTVLITARRAPSAEPSWTRCWRPAGTSWRPGSCPRSASACPSGRGSSWCRPTCSTSSEVRDAVTKAAFGPGGLRAVVNLVGGYAAGAPLHETSLEDFEKLFRLNLRPTFLVTRAARAVHAGRGRRLDRLRLRAGRRAAVRGAVGYISSKAAVLAFAQAVAADYRDLGVRCNAVLPSVVDTPANRSSQPDADHSRWVAPAEIAGVIRFLCSDDSAPVSGAAVPVYGRA